MVKKIPSRKKRLVLLDAHAILHRAFHALPDFTAPNGEPTGALYGLVAMLLAIIEQLRPDYIVACFDLAGPTYRHDAYEKYKAGRVKTDDSLVAQINRSRDIFEAFGIRIYDHAGFEADDMLGTIVEQTKKMKDLDIVIASGDMDTLQLITKKKVQVYTLRKGIKDTIMYDEAMVKERYGFGPERIADYKGLRGDPSDNIPGVVGIGEKTATELITRFGSIEQIYKKLAKSEEPFLKAKISPRIVALLKENEEEAQFSKMLATIRRDAPIAFVLPDETWREALDVPKVLDLFSEFGFRTLGSRIRQLFGSDAVASLAPSPDGEGALPEAAEEIPDDLLRKTAVALWLLRSDITNPSIDDILDYGRSNGKTQTFKEASEYIFKELNESGVRGLYTDVELPLIDVLKKMEVVGIRLDRAYLGELSKELHKELSGIETRIYKHAGMEFNINSPKQLGAILYDTLGLKPKNQKRTAGGQRSTKESELEKLRDEHPVIKDILRYRELAKLLGTYIDNLPGMVGKDDRLHTTFLQAGSVTGRMATQNPGLQNIPIRSENGFKIRRAFVAPQGFRLVAIDYSQIDLRIAAILSGDPKMIEIFKAGEDVHSAVASRVFGVPENDVDREMRRRAKVINFGILYGMGVNALRQNLGEDTPRAEAQEFLTAYFHTFTTLAQYLEDVKSSARKLGYTETYFGRRRYFEGIRSSIPFIRASAERMALNAPIQGTAADVIRIAMVRVDEYLKEAKLEDDVRMILQVHDELIFEVKQSRIAEVTPKLKEIMEQAFPEKDAKGVPLLAEAKAGPSWGSLEKI
jgi:DNA polymerase-1